VRELTFLLILCLLWVAPAVAQSPTATINGIVLDPSGAAIVGAQVVVVNDATGVQYTSRTNGEGIYVVPNLSPGSYRIQVSNSGFKTIIKPDVVIHIQDALAINFTLPIGAASEIVTVQGGAPLVNTENAAVSTVIDRNFVESLPLNGRSFNMLLQLTPGVVVATTKTNGAIALGQFSVAGQRTDANSFTVDGVSANFGTGPFLSLGQSGLGGFQALSAVGGTSSLVSVDALQEFRIQTSSFSPEFGKTPGGQVSLTTRSGTSQFHGGIFEYFRNDILDANDWFANTLPGSPHSPERHNDFGGFLGGPIWRDKTFFFFSYEGARLRLPQSRLITVPSASARSSASAALAPFLDAYPQPNGPVSPDGSSAQFTGVWSDRATLNATSLRIDHSFSERFSVFARYNYAPSQLVTRTGSISSVSSTLSNVQTGTAGVDIFLGSIANTIRANYSTQGAATIDALDAFSGAVPPSPSLLFGDLPARTNLAFFSNSDTGTLFDGTNTRNRTKQFNIVDTAAVNVGSHLLKFGEDYRLIDFGANVNQHILTYSAGTVAQFLAAGKSSLFVSTFNDARIRAQSFSLFAQDTWKIASRLTLTYGIRWELSPAPSALNGTILASWVNTDSPSQIVLAPAGASLWKTTYGNFAPRLGIAYRLTHAGDLVLRAGGGTFYDLGTGIASQAAVLWPNSQSKFNANVPLPISSATPYTPPPASLQAPYGVPGQLFSAFDSNLKLPRSYQWNVALEKSFLGHQAVSATYVGQVGSDVLRLEVLVQPNANFAPRSVFQLTTNSANSNYQALQVQYRKPLANGLQALLNYSWSHSIDNASNDNVAVFSNTLVPLSAQGDRGNSDFDVRHSFSGAVTYTLPSVGRQRAIKYVTEGWSADGVAVARSGVPFNAALLFSSPGPIGRVLSRPDLVPGQPFWIAQPGAPGGKILNSILDPNTGAIIGGAFLAPSAPRQGTEGRNDIPGFGLTQVDLSVGRKFPITERVSLQFRTDAFNVFNHPNFSNPSGILDLGDPTQLQAPSMLNVGLGGLNPLFQEGGPRSLQLSLRLTF
jgi:hypothetical protein